MKIVVSDTFPNKFLFIPDKNIPIHPFSLSPLSPCLFQSASVSVSLSLPCVCRLDFRIILHITIHQLTENHKFERDYFHVGKFNC